MKLRLLHIAPHYGGGVGAVVHSLVEYLQVNHLAFNYVVSIDLSLSDVSSKFQEISVPFDSGLFLDFSRYTSLFDSADIVLIHYWNHPLLTVFLSSFDFPRSKLIFWTHISGLNEPNIIPDCLGESSSQLVFSSAISNALLGRKPVSWCSRTSVVHSTSDLSKFLNASSSHFKKPISRRVVYVGTVSRQKIHPRISCIVEKLASCSVDIDIVGQVDDPALVSSLRPFSSVRLHGWQKNVLPYLVNADCFIYPLADNHYGTGEQVILEALAVGLPAVCMKNPAESLIVDHGQTGFLASSVEEFCDSVLYLLSCPSLLISLAHQASQIARTRFSLPTSASHFLQIFRHSFESEELTHSGRFFVVNDFDLPFASCILSSLEDRHVLNAYTEGDYDRSVALALEAFLSSGIQLEIIRSPSKGSPFQYLRYFPSSPLVRMLCKKLLDSLA